MMEAYPERTVLAGVPRVHFYEGGERCPEDIILPSVMRAVLEFLGEADYGCRRCLAQNPDCTVLCTYAYLVGVSGAAAYLSWKEGFHDDNPAIFYMSADAEAPERHIFDAIGYSFEWVVKKGEPGDEARFRERIAESLRRRMPVLGYGVIGPPEASIVTGYDEGGEVLLGWSYFEDENTERDSTGYFRVHDWFNNAECLLIIGEKRGKPSLEVTCRTALEWLLEVTRTPMVRPERDAPAWYQDRHNGLAAYDAWSAHLLSDEAWPAEDEATLRAHHRVHDDAIGTVAEARWYGSVFLAQVVEGFVAGPHKRGTHAEVLHAAACYAAEHDLMWEVWELAGGIGNPDAYQAMADPGVRRTMAGLVRQAREQDARAAEHIARALGT
jgi:hypothetical protein